MKPYIYTLPKSQRKRGPVRWDALAIYAGGLLLAVAVFTAMTLGVLAAVNHFFP
ncbi:hypothetical protein HQ447_05535 [bacterium]|nr:hypothetical protein [bacterium]